MKALLLLFSFVFAAAGCQQAKAQDKAAAPPKPPSVTTPAGTGSHILHAGTWTAEVMDPNDPLRYNTGVRFTPVATVLQVSSGDHSYCFRPDLHVPVNENAGFPTEFDLTTDPPGFPEAAIGDGYVKVGIGVLKKDNNRYVFYGPHPVVELAPTTVTWAPDSATFSQICPGVNGYAYALKAVVHLSPGVLEFDWSLTNTGTKEFTTSTYTHDFFQFLNPPQNIGYEMRFPYVIHPTRDVALVDVDPQAIRFTRDIPKAANIAVPYPADYTGPNQVIVVYPATGQQIVCETSQPGVSTAVHASERYICPEQFIAIHAGPGETKSWSRIYHFQDKAPTP